MVVVDKPPKVLKCYGSMIEAQLSLSLSVSFHSPKAEKKLFYSWYNFFKDTPLNFKFWLSTAWFAFCPHYIEGKTEGSGGLFCLVNDCVPWPKIMRCLVQYTSFIDVLELILLLRKISLCLDVLKLSSGICRNICKSYHYSCIISPRLKF